MRLPCYEFRMLEQRWLQEAPAAVMRSGIYL
jgi:hypothetical protein